MTADDAIPIDVRHLFADEDPDMFDSTKSFKKAGFDVVERTRDTRIMAASHDDAKGYLFKKYNNDRRADEQLENYQIRIEGARLLRALIDERGLRNIVVPRKWLYELPAQFATERKGLRRPSYVLIVEKFKILEDSKSEYGSIDKQTLRELCAVVYRFPGLDSTPKNVPFTKDGKIAFIDTESWERHEGRRHLKYIGEYLSADRLELARDIFDELEEEAKRERKQSRKETK